MDEYTPGQATVIPEGKIKRRPGSLIDQLHVGDLLFPLYGLAALLIGPGGIPDVGAVAFTLGGLVLYLALYGEYLTSSTSR